MFLRGHFRPSNEKMDGRELRKNMMERLMCGDIFKKQGLQILYRYWVEWGKRPTNDALCLFSPLLGLWDRFILASHEMFSGSCEVMWYRHGIQAPRPSGEMAELGGQSCCLLVSCLTSRCSDGSMPGAASLSKARRDRKHGDILTVC